MVSLRLSNFRAAILLSTCKFPSDRQMLSQFLTEKLCCAVFWNVPLTGTRKNSYSETSQRKDSQKSSFLEELHTYTLQRYLNKLFTALAFSHDNLCDCINILLHKWSITGGGLSENVTSSIRTMSLIDEKQYVAEFSKETCSFNAGVQPGIFRCTGGFLEQGQFNKRFMYGIQQKDLTRKKLVFFVQDTLKTSF